MTHRLGQVIILTTSLCRYKFSNQGVDFMKSASESENVYGARLEAKSVECEGCGSAPVVGVGAHHHS